MNQPLEILKKLALWGMTQHENIFCAVSAASDLAAEAEQYLSSGVRHFFVTGRVPYDHEDTGMHIVAADAKSAEEAYARAMYAGSRRELPADWDDDEKHENPFIYINDTTEILGPPLEGATEVRIVP